MKSHLVTVECCAIFSVSCFCGDYIQVYKCGDYIQVYKCGDYIQCFCGDYIQVYKCGDYIQCFCGDYIQVYKCGDYIQCFCSDYIQVYKTKCTYFNSTKTRGTILETLHCLDSCDANSKNEQQNVTYNKLVQKRRLEICYITFSTINKRYI